MGIAIKRDMNSWGQSAVIISIISLCLLAGMAAPAGARTPTISDIQSGDTIFVYEQDLNISALKGSNPASQVTYLCHYTNFNSGTTDNQLAVSNQNSFDLLDSAVNGIYGTYYAWNGSGLIDDGTGGSHTYYWVGIQAPDVSIEPVLANPNHVYSLEGLSVSDETNIAFKITSSKMGSQYRVGTTYPAKIDILVTSPSGSQTTYFGGSDLSAIPIDSTVIYTDDARGAISLKGLQSGTYTAKAEWSAPPAFVKVAPDSAAVTFTMTGRVAFTDTPTSTPTPAPATPTETETSPPTTLPTETTAVPPTPTAPPATTEQAAVTPGLPVIALCAGLVLVLLRKR